MTHTLDLARIAADLQRQLDPERWTPDEPFISISADDLRGLIEAATEREPLKRMAFQAQEMAKEITIKLVLAETELDHWKGNHDAAVQRCAVLRERPDLPADRIPSIQRYEAIIVKLRAKLANLRANLLVLAEKERDHRSGPCPTCGFSIVTGQESPSFQIDDEPMQEEPT